MSHDDRHGSVDGHMAAATALLATVPTAGLPPSLTIAAAEVRALLAVAEAVTELRRSGATIHPLGGAA